MIATIHEVMRCKPLLPFAVHATLQDTEVGGYFVPSGTMVHYSSLIYVLLYFQAPISQSDDDTRVARSKNAKMPVFHSTCDRTTVCYFSDNMYVQYAYGIPEGNVGFIHIS